MSLENAYTSFTAAEALQHLSSPPAGIDNELWEQLFLQYGVGKDDKVPTSRVAEWNDFGRFLAGDISSQDYFDPAHANQRANIEAVADKLHTQPFNDSRDAVNSVLYKRIHEARGDGRWKDEAVRPEVRMYLDAARLANSRLMVSAQMWNANKFPSESSAVYEAELQEKLSDAFDEAMLSPKLKIDNFGGFVSAVMQRRIIDFHRTRLGRTEANREKRLRYTSLDAVLYHGDGRDTTRMDTIGAGHYNASSYAIDAAGILTEMREYADSLSDERDRRFMHALIDGKEQDPKATFKQIGASLGQSEGNFYFIIKRALRRMLERRPELRDEILALTGGYTKELTRVIDLPAEGTHEPLWAERRAAARAQQATESQETIGDGILPVVREVAVSMDKEEQTARQKLSIRVRELKDKIRSLFISEDGSRLNIGRLSQEAGLTHANLASVLMGERNNVDPRKGGALSDTVGNHLAGYLQTHGHEERVPEFRRLFDEMRQETGHVARVRTSAKSDLERQ